MKTLFLIPTIFLSIFYLGLCITGAGERVIAIDSLGKNNGNPVELGDVNWLRNFDKAKAAAEKENKPLLIFFQEVPGCSTASGYGKRVMTHPLIIEAIETLFVPLAIFNNAGGHDREVLNSFNEPSWNNPVVRIITPDGKSLAGRLSGDYTRLGLVNSMITALKNNNQEVPRYLEILQKELSAMNGGKDSAVFSMYCFWSGEAGLGKIEGVVSTEPGFMGGMEVVKVDYDPSVVSYEELVNTAGKENVSKTVFVKSSRKKMTAEKVLGPGSVHEAGSFRPDSEPKYYMSKTFYRFIPMTSLQASLVNSAILSKKSPDIYLSPHQIEILSYVRNNPESGWKNTIGNKDITATWADVIKAAAGI